MQPDAPTSTAEAPAAAEGTTPSAVNTTPQEPSTPDAGAQPAATPDKPADPAPAAPPAPETPDPTLPDHGIDPDKGIDPDAGDQPPETAANPVEDAANKLPVFKNRAERAEYFRNLQDTTRSTVSAAIKEAYQTTPFEDLVSAYEQEGADNFQAQMLARAEINDQQTKLAEDSAKVVELNATLATDAFQAVQTIDWLNPNNKEHYNEKSADTAIRLYDDLCTVKDPKSGQIIHASMTPSQFLGAIDGIRREAAEGARIEAQKAAEQQYAAVAPSTSNATVRETPFEQLSVAEQRAQLQAKGYNIT
jgi:hypothetical protein